jgi:hypothetical protein
MTDFLSRLVERSFGTVPAIRPRVSSLFEPISSPPSSAATEAAGPQTLVDHAEERMGRGTPLHEGVTETGERETVPHILPSPRRVVDVTPVSAWAATRDTVVDPKPDHRVIARDRFHEEPVAAPRHPDVAVEQVTPVHAAAGQWSAPSQTAERMSNEAGVTNDGRGLVVPSRAAARVAADVRQTAAALHGTARHRGDDAHAIATPIQTPSERDVHVTIGRIEVRAVSTGKVPTGQPSASPVMSLDSYLRRQARRGAE